MKKRKVKKIVWVILAAAIVLLAVVGTSVLFRKPEDNTVVETNTPAPEEPVIDNQEENTAAETSTAEPEETIPPEEAIIIENQGDIELIIPEDMESDGF